MAIIEVKDLVKKFDDFTAVDSISFSVEQGEIFAFLGPNGAGKTTAFYMVVGIVAPDEGQVIFRSVRFQPGSTCDRISSGATAANE
jgi:ABC-2 type transport system ATP-binding protein